MKKDLFLCSFSKDALKIIKKNKIGMESNHFCISCNLDDENFDDTIAVVRRDMEFCEIDDVSRLFVHGPFTEIYPQAIDPKAVRMGLDRLEDAYRGCRELRATRMVVHSGFLPIMYFDEWHVKQSIEFWTEYMQDKPDDFNIYIENVFDPNPEPLVEIVKGISDPRVKLCLDVGHANAVTEDKDVYQWIKIMGEHIGHFHIHNNDGSGDQHNEITNGTLDMELVLRCIDDYCKEDVTLTVESRESSDSIPWILEKLSGER